MNLRREILVTLILAFFAHLCSGQEMLVSGEWLEAHRADPQLVILHVGTEKDYAEGHIPGAVLVTLDMISDTDVQGIRVQIPPVADLEETLGHLGIGNQSRVVIYAGTPSVQSATRVWFTFDYLGRSNLTSLLDGGLRLWRQQNRPLSTEVVQPRPTRLHTQPEPHRVARLPWLKEHYSVHPEQHPRKLIS